MRLMKRALMTALVCAAALASIYLFIRGPLGSIHAQVEKSGDASYPKMLVHAFVAAEDPDFFEHQALTVASVNHGTLTSQLVRSSEGLRERGLARQFQWLLTTIAVDIRYDKSVILHTYMRSVYVGTHNGKPIYGVHAAAEAYFGKRPGALRLSESALVAGLLRSPSLYSPTQHPGKAIERRNRVLARMLALGYIQRNAFDQAAREPVQGPDFVDQRASITGDDEESPHHRRMDRPLVRPSPYQLLLYLRRDP